MSANPLIPPKFRAFDANGDPLVGGKLYSYEAGTTTPLATYTTRAADVPNANPVVLDANGEANVWLGPGTDYKLELQNSASAVQWTIDNVPAGVQEDATADVVATDPGGRLSLTSGTPVTSGDVAGATAVYWVPYKHNRVPLYDGSSWSLHSIPTELSQTLADATKSPAATSADLNYDVFLWNDAGVERISRGPPWTSGGGSAVVRGTGAGSTELERVDGRLVNKVSISNGPGAQRGLYVGTIRTGGSNTVNDTVAFRHCWNQYNRVARPMRVLEAAPDWNYTTATLRQARASAANQLDFVRGADEDLVEADVTIDALNSAGGTFAIVGIGLDSTSALASGVTSSAATLTTANEAVGTQAKWRGFPGLGRHTLVWLEFASVGGTTTWLSPSATQKPGITGTING